jgi:uncharacterized membrane protein
MTIEKLEALKAWQLMLALLALGVGVALVVWGLVWVLWMIRPLLAAAGGLGAVGWTLYVLRRHRRREEWSGQEWLGS